MLGLGAYASSDEEEDDIEMIDGQNEDVETRVTQSGKVHQENVKSRPTVPPVTVHTEEVAHKDAVPGKASEDLSEVTTTQGPVMPEHHHTNLQITEQVSSSGSSYLAEREVIRSLTLPPVPDFSVPPSPPGSPPAGATKKFEHFLKLKKQGIHFNSKLESSPALRNPALLQKLQEFAKIDEWDQYASALPDELGVPTAYPPWAYSFELNKMQQVMQKKKEEHKSKNPRSTLEFVPGAVSRPSVRNSSAQAPRKRARQ